MRYLFFLIIFLIPVGLANAEVGKNFDTQPLGNGLTKWTSHPDRIFDSSGWKNYIYTDDTNSIKYESAGISFKLDKNDCTFNLYDSGIIGGRQPDINSFSHNLKLDGVDVVESCTILSIIQLPDSVQVTVNNGKFSTVYNLSYVGSVEWTFNFDNKEGKQTTYTIEDICKSCVVTKTQGDLIQFGKFILDTKNSEHKTLIDSQSKNEDYIMTYEKTLDDKQSFSIDPTFSSTGNTMMGRDSAIANPACGTGVGLDILSTQLGWDKVDSLDAVFVCSAGVFEVDVTSIPDTSGIYSSSFSGTVTSASNPTNNNFTKISSATQPSTRVSNPANALALYNEAKTGTPLQVNVVKFQTPALNEQISLGRIADDAFRADISSGKNWLAIGFIPASNTRDGLDHQILISLASSTLTFIYGTSANAITDLHATNTRATAVDLAWTAPTIFGGTSTGYEINDTTPWNNPLTIIISNTSSAATSYTVSPLTGSTNYSFRVSAATNVINDSGNIINITTGFDPTVSFTPGTFDITISGVDVRTFKFNRTDTSNSTILEVRYPNTFNATCNFYNKFALTNKTFTNLADVAVNSAEDKATFTFQGLNNDIVDVNCYDTPTNVTGRYLITQSHFAFQDQIANFRNGTFGTHGDFGVFDLITIFAVLFSMIGFNRINAPVGAVLSIVVLGTFAYFGLIQWYTGTTVLMAIVILFAWTTHKDSGN